MIFGSLARSRTMMQAGERDPACLLIQQLGINQASDIDLESIAQSVGVQVRVGFLESCEARLIGFRDRAIITVARNSDRRRRRFSIAHELGHWHHHRGRMTLCEVLDPSVTATRADPVEREADHYAANLLMPSHLFGASVQRRAHRTLGVISALSHEYRTSRIATMLRVIELNLWPCMMIVQDAQGRIWSRRSSSFLIKEPLKRALPHKVLTMSAKTQQVERPKHTAASDWFVGDASSSVRLTEQCCRAFGSAVLTLLVTCA